MRNTYTHTMIIFTLGYKSITCQISKEEGKFFVKDHGKFRHNLISMLLGGLLQNLQLTGMLTKTNQDPISFCQILDFLPLRTIICHYFYFMIGSAGNAQSLTGMDT